MVKPERPELQRFKGIVGRVVTVNYNGKAIIDFQDGGWYDIAASEESCPNSMPPKPRPSTKTSTALNRCRINKADRFI